ncbi:peptidoglycan-binding domain-containing protein [Methanobacterium ferruginis]|uniref:peptidoglycan-binding domain-containing protein n=1 Tax=Methanobacterium ferruginis TaxID=710191 RepID=UPI0025722DF2|nr:peptidoglycan-binding protein [Methanobacterium ferruginis]
MSCFLELGSKGDDRIALLERRLKYLGYYRGVIDDYYGPLLNQAVQQYQANKGLQMDCVGPITWNSLFPSDTCPSNWLYQGCQGDNVKAQQITLQGLGFYTGYKVDGDFGQYMDQEVRKFQQATGIIVDGIIGDQTIKAELTYQKTAAKPVTDGNCFESAQYTVWKQEMNKYTRRTCGPFAVKEAIFEWGLNPDIDTVVKYINTQLGYTGTAPSDILEGVPKLTDAMSVPCKAYLMNHTEIGGFPGLGEVLADPKKTTIAHIAYKSSSCNHYHTPVKLCLNEKRITIAENLHGAYEKYSFAGYTPLIENCAQKTWMIFEQI